ncbi:MAG: hypothetical protein J6U20_10905 [Fibrobacter sp.]|jgi:hypothetical protein|nr:hypothetical protein [Fibrobacter sp.]
MRKLVCLVIVFCVFSFAEVNGDSTKAAGIFERYSDNVMKSDFLSSLGGDLTAWTNHVDAFIGVWMGERIANGLYLNSFFLGNHFLSDETDSCTRVGAGMVVNGSFLVASFIEALFFQSDKMFLPMFTVMTLLNPTLEFFVVRKYVPVSIGVGYNTDWFAFSPGRELYFRAHGDLNVNILWARLSASYSYSFLDSYDLKKGSKKIYLRLFFGPAGILP